MGRDRFNLARRRHVREPRRRFYLFCEGKNTEPGYFDAMQRRYRNSQIRIMAIGPAGVPGTIAKSAVAFKLGINTRIAKQLTSSFEEGDEVWAVFDRDTHKCYYDATEKCERAGIGVARSNPCFELWLILHEQDFDKAVDHHAVEKHLKKIRADYDPKCKTLDFDEIILKAEHAERRAEKQMKARCAEKGRVLRPPYTTVNNLTRSIREAAVRASPI